MGGSRISTRPPKGDRRLPRRLESAEDLAPYLSDEAHFPGGRAEAVFLPKTEAEVAEVLLHGRTILASGARSSLTGGATPAGGWVLSMERMERMSLLRHEFHSPAIRAEAGVTLTALEAWVGAEGFWYPPVPTFTGARVGGVVATNAAGAATFKYGSTRQWVLGLTVVLASGEVLDLTRGAVTAGSDGIFEVVSVDGEIVRVPVPSYAMPNVQKRSAGYHAEPGMDLVDLFIGSEGTLGIVTEAVLALEPVRRAPLTALVMLDSEERAIALSAALREEALPCQSGRCPAALDVSAIEYLDRRCLEILREDGEDRRLGVPISASDGAAVLVQAELPPLPGGAPSDSWMREIAAYQESDAPDSPLVRFCRLLDGMEALERVQLALPGDSIRSAQLLALREAVPAGVNRRIGEAKRRVDASIHKVAADMIVPFDRFAEMMRIYRSGFTARGLDHAIWGHISDGNVHPNVIPTSVADVESGKAAVLEFGQAIARLGGCPLSEHGVGRNPIKQELLRQLYGQAGIDQMRAVKLALDPAWKLAPGVLFAAR